jgi:hypothetical protein
VRSKYIIIERAGMDVPLVFSRFLQHAEVAGTSKVKSAGFCELDVTGKWIVVGQSTSLDLAARAQDSEILNTHLRMREMAI